MKSKIFFAMLTVTAVAVLVFSAAHTILAAENSSKVLAIVGSEKIDEKYIEQKMAMYPRGPVARYGSEMFVEKVLTDTIENKLFARAARDIKLDKSELVQFKIQDAIETLLAQEYKEYLLKKAAPSEDELRQFYEKNKENYKIPEAVRVRHLALKTDNEAREVLKLLKEGADFGETAKTRSVRKTGISEGDLGWVGRGRLLPELEAAAFAMKNEKPGALSGVIEGEGLFHIIRFEGYKDEEIVPFEKAKEQFMRVLVDEKRTKLIADARERLRKDIGVKIFGEGEAVTKDKLKGKTPEEKKGR